MRDPEKGIPQFFLPFAPSTPPAPLFPRHARPRPGICTDPVRHPSLQTFLRGVCAPGGRVKWASGAAPCTRDPSTRAPCPRCHVKVLEINLPGELLGTSSLTGLWPTVEILQVDIIAETTYDVEAQVLDTADKALLGEVGVGHNEITDGQQLLGKTGQHPQIPPREGIRVFHPLGAVGFSTTALLGEVHASGGCEKQLHGINDELFESFA